VTSEGTSREKEARKEKKKKKPNHWGPVPSTVLLDSGPWGNGVPLGGRSLEGVGIINSPNVSTLLWKSFSFQQKIGKGNRVNWRWGNASNKNEEEKQIQRKKKQR